MDKNLVSILLVLTIGSLAGCTTLSTLGEEEHNNKIYSGTIRQVELGCGHGVCIDFPFSLVADTVLLPVTIPWSIYNTSTDSAKKVKTRRNSKISQFHHCHRSQSTAFVEQLERTAA